MPTTIFVVNASPKTRVPTRIAVIGSNTPSMEAFVAPMLRVAMANVAVDIIEDYLKIVEFIEWLKDFYPEKAEFLKKINSLF